MYEIKIVFKTKQSMKKVKSLNSKMAENHIFFKKKKCFQDSNFNLLNFGNFHPIKFLYSLRNHINEKHVTMIHLNIDPQGKHMALIAVFKFIFRTIAIDS